MGYPAPKNLWRFETVSNASQTPEYLYVPECLIAGPLQHIQAGTLKQLQLFLYIQQFAPTSLGGIACMVHLSQ